MTNSLVLFCSLLVYLLCQFIYERSVKVAGDCFDFIKLFFGFFLQSLHTSLSRSLFIITHFTTERMMNEEVIETKKKR